MNADPQYLEEACRPVAEGLLWTAGLLGVIAWSPHSASEALLWAVALIALAIAALLRLVAPRLLEVHHGAIGAALAHHRDKKNNERALDYPDGSKK